MSDHKTTWETYTRSWNTTDETEKRQLFGDSLSEACVYTDPLAQVSGFDGLTGYMAEFHRQIPGGRLQTIEFMSHNDRSIARWDMFGADGAKISDGVSYGRYDGQGKLVEMTGFFATP